MSAWEEYLIARHPGRPSPRAYLEGIFEDSFELRGDRAGAEDAAVVTALARFQGRPVVVAGFDRKSPTAAGFRKATRAIGLAGRLRLPLITFADTPGADPRFESEYSGLAAAIAATFEAILTVETPVVSIVTGEGGSGGALALACGDLVGAQEHAVFSVIAPEGAAEILYRDASRAEEVAEMLRPTSRDLVSLGLADEVIPEPSGGAHLDPGGAAAAISGWLVGHLPRLRHDLDKRLRRFSRN